MANEFKFNPMLLLSHVGGEKQQRLSEPCIHYDEKDFCSNIHSTCMTFLLDLSCAECNSNFATRLSIGLMQAMRVLSATVLF